MAGGVVRAPEPMHGKLSRMHHTGKSVFRGLNNDFNATRYHSLTIAPESMPETLEVTATSEDGVIQGVMHKSHPVHGVQFHPESIASENGHALARQFSRSRAMTEIFDPKRVAETPLTADEAARIFGELLSGRAEEDEIKAFLLALSARKPATSEFVGAVAAVRAQMKAITAPPMAIDLCGTGGDGLGTLNISTAVSFVVAAAGVPVAKHGNRSMSSKSGAADILEALGVKIDLEPATAERTLRETGIVFLFAQTHHPAMAPCRRRPAAPSASAPSSIFWARWPARPGSSANWSACSRRNG